MSAGSARRKLFVPEAIQTSAMDCGPACLKSVLAGYDVPVSYGRLREACHTSVDGTSISALQSVLEQLGVEATEVVVPAEHVLLPAAGLLPAVVVITLPSGILHFVVAWRRLGPFVQIMDPARGRAWVHARAFERSIAQVELPVPADAFDAFASDEAVRPALEARLRGVGCAQPAAVAQAAIAGGRERFVQEEGALRFAERLRAEAGLSRAAAERARLAMAADPAAIPEPLLSARPAPDADGTPMVRLKGAVVLTIDGPRPADAPAAPALERARGTSDERVLPILRDLLARARRAPLALLALGLFAAALGGLLEAVIFRAFFDLGSRLPLLSHRVAAVLLAALFAAGILALEWPILQELTALGRRLEGGLRRAFLDRLPRLADAYFQSRPVSDLATRAHQIHQMRTLPFFAGQGLRVGCELVVTTAGVVWLYPAGAPLALALLAATVLVPLLFQGGHEERDMRVRAHGGALSVFYLDALLGLQAIRAHTGEAALAREHDDRLAPWAHAAWRAARYAIRAEAVTTLVGYGLALALLFRYLEGARGSGWALLLVYWTLSLPALGQELAFLLQQLPRMRNLTARLMEPLGAPEEERPTPARAAAGAVALSLRDVRVEAGGHDVLTVGALEIAAGSHVAVVGSSGSGKTSLLGLLLGWHRPADGEVLCDGQPLTAASLEALRAATVWVDPAVQLWNRSLLDNLRYGSSRPDGPVGESIEEAELDEVLARLPTGLESALGEGGSLLSGGEGQRVRHARGVHRPAARLVLLDEAFRGLERDRRHRLLARARQRWRSATLLCATHDVAETLGFDRVLVIDEGKIVEDGAPAALAAQAGSRYARFLAVEDRLRGLLADPSWRRWTLGDRQVRIDEAAEEAGSRG